MESNLKNVVSDKNLKWIFVGGKGGVGKTTTSCTLALLIAKSRPESKVLIISTDPAHNTSDTFDTKLKSSPEIIKGTENLYGMEVDPTTSQTSVPNFGGENEEEQEEIRNYMGKVFNNLPGMDEAFAYVEVMKLIKDNKYDTVIFDTAPTGHTLRLLDFPNIIQKGLSKFIELRDMMSPMMSMMGPMLAAQSGNDFDYEKMNKKLDDLVPLVQEIKCQFQDPTKTTFICVCIAEFLSLYETERLVQKLCELEIDSKNIVVNQLIKDSEGVTSKMVFESKQKIQNKYIAQYESLYSDFYLVKLPLLDKEIRGTSLLTTFSNLLTASTNPTNSIQEPVLDNKKLKWIFVGGKGGVGKTTTSCSVALTLAKERENVLLISTDPAHNTSDAFNQKFSKEPTQVNGFDNLFCMEISADISNSKMPDSVLDSLEQSSDFLTMGKKLLTEMLGSCPGIDEAMAYYEIWRLVSSMNYDVVVFDTAPTGHTLRLLNFPNILEESLEKMIKFKQKMGSMVTTLTSMMGAEQVGVDIKNLFDQCEEYLPAIRKIKEEFKDPEQTTFISVCISEFLSLYETERLIQELAKLEIDCQTLCINQLVVNDDQSEALYNHRLKQQKKYLEQIDDLYGEDFHITEMPILPQEIRGLDQLENFGKLML